MNDVIQIPVAVSDYELNYYELVIKELKREIDQQNQMIYLLLNKLNKESQIKITDKELVELPSNATVIKEYNYRECYYLLAAGLHNKDSI